MGSPPSEFEVKEIKIIDDDGYPSLYVRFYTNKYHLLCIKLFDDKGKLIDERFPKEGEEAVTLMLTPFKPYENIVGARMYSLKAYYGDKLMYNESISVQGIDPDIKLLKVGAEKSFGIYTIKYLEFLIENKGDAPLYINVLNTEVYIDGKSSPASVKGDKVTILPGEKATVTLEILSPPIEKPTITLELLIKGDKQNIEKTFQIDLRTVTQ